MWPLAHIVHWVQLVEDVDFAQELKPALVAVAAAVVVVVADDDDGDDDDC